jgi:tetratricopeptide (TPR) repeat protein
VLVVDANIFRQFKFRFQGKRVGDHLEGTVLPEGETEAVAWVGRSTTKDKVAALTPSAPTQSEDQKVLNAALSSKAGAERTGALRQFLKDYPDSKLKEQASLQLAQSYSTADEKIAALRKFIEDFPASRLKDQAEYLILGTLTNPAERQSAQEAFVKAYPKSAYGDAVYRTLLEAYMREKPVNEAKLNAAIDGFINATPDMALPLGEFTMNRRAGAMNTVADRLMVNEVMLDRALEIIRKGVAAAGDKEQPQSRAIYVTTLGQVLYKLKQYDEAERELKRAIGIAGPDGDGEAVLYLGKIYEAQHNDDAALDAYFRAAQIASNPDTKTSLERLYTKKHGSLAGLVDKLDEIYRARPKAFDPGHYARAAGTTGPRRVVLAELFTGAECGPCVAADLAFDGLSERYGHSDVAELVYHLHIPGPDPMTNADTEARSKYYEVRGTPTAVLDGQSPQVGGGSSAQAAKLFADYKGKIESRLDTRPLATLTGFKAKVDGQTIKVSGQADLVPDGGGRVPKATLHVALVEDMVRYTGSNGVRFHSLVVRKLLGSPAGTPLQRPGAKTKVSESVNVAALGDTLDTYLQKFETDRSKPNAEFKFQDRVDRLDPKHLLVVVFVQDDQTKEILQAIFVTPAR